MAPNESRAPERERRQGVSDSERPPGARVPPAHAQLERSSPQSGGKRAAQRTALREPAVRRRALQVTP